MMQYLVGVLMALTVTLLAWHHFGMERVLELSATSGHPIDVRDDRGDSGSSIGALKTSGKSLVMDCDLKKKFAWPYCGFWFLLGTEPNGVDLSEFETVTFDLSYSGPGPHTIRVYIRNYEPEISTTEEWMSQKVNEIEFVVPEHGTIDIPVKLLRSAAWWIKQRKTPLMHTDMRIDNATVVELSTGTFNEVGQHQIELRSVKFRGKWISQNHLLMILVGAWFTCGVIWPALGALHFRAQLRSSKARLALLDGINQALQLEAQELAGQAYTDPLTGALNRQGLRDTLMKQWQGPAPATPASTSVIFVDLDHFKRTNDQHGHAVGDAVLRSFAGMVKTEIRSTDKLVRWGGEEFLIVCGNTSAAQAQVLAGKLREVMALQVWPCALQITASFGVTALTTGEDIGDAIKRADGALYKAKANGRNCVEVA